jgi:hypothetical protein
VRLLLGIDGIVLSSVSYVMLTDPVQVFEHQTLYASMSLLVSVAIVALCCINRVWRKV